MAINCLALLANTVPGHRTPWERHEVVLVPQDRGGSEGEGVKRTDERGTLHVSLKRLAQEEGLELQ